MKITVSFLPTIDDYVAFLSCASARKITNRKKLISLITGIFLIALGFVLRFELKGNFFVMGLMIMAGIFLCLYFPFLYPFFVKSRAIRYFEQHQEKMNAVSYIFEEDYFSVLSDRYELRNAPYETVYAAAENEDVLLLVMGETEFQYIPKRVFNTGECEWLKNKLKDFA